MRNSLASLLYIIALLFIPSSSFSAEWQWSVTVGGFISPETNDHPKAFLWIPDNCKFVRAVIVAQHNMLEEGILENSTFRSRMKSLGIAQIWISPGISQDWNPKSKVQLVFDNLLDSLSKISGYDELKYAPLIPMGHSAMATFPWNFAALNNNRTLAVLSIHGDAPSTNLTGYGRSNLDWSQLKIDGIPGLMVEGEYEWWEARVQPGLDYKRQNPNSCISFLCDAGRGHFDYSAQLIDYLCLFIEKAVKYRMPKQTTKNKFPNLIPANPTKGWLADRWHIDSVANAKAAPFYSYKGNRDDAFWYFDKEMVTKTEEIYARQRGKLPQYPGYVFNGRLISYNSKHFYGYVPGFSPDNDGVTFKLATAFTDSLHRQVSNNHANRKSEITRICGPVIKVNDSTFRVQFYRMGLNNPKRTADICLMLSNDGDKKYKSAVQQCLIRIPYRNTEGTTQQITFDTIPDIPYGTRAINLKASSTSGLKVYFYVEKGPAEIVDNKLVFTKLPPRSKFPVGVTVVAWQHGRCSEPKVATAAAVTQSFNIIKE